jgi:hypothetical protein
MAAEHGVGDWHSFNAGRFDSTHKLLNFEQ